MVPEDEDIDSEHERDGHKVEAGSPSNASSSSSSSASSPTASASDSRSSEPEPHRTVFDGMQSTTTPKVLSLEPMSSPDHTVHTLPPTEGTLSRGTLRMRQTPNAAALSPPQIYIEPSLSPSVHSVEREMSEGQMSSMQREEATRFAPLDIADWNVVSMPPRGALSVCVVVCSPNSNGEVTPESYLHAKSNSQRGSAVGEEAKDWGIYPVWLH